MKTRSSGWCLLAVVLLCACSGNHTAPVVTAAQAVPREWLGKWLGPEGTWLQIAQSGEEYTVTIMNLDAARRFAAVPTGTGLSFERDGVRETLRATDGSGTGMKWLAGKTNCLVVRAGEGFCRD
jgi:hypothetical protein